MNELNHEHMRAWEKRLTAEQINYAMALAYQNGWKKGSAPMWVWAQLFRKAEEAYPTNKQEGN